jgi:hypothetical protein
LALIAMPLIQANLGGSETIITPVNSDDPDVLDIAIKPLDERIDARSITIGITFIVIYAILSCYLISPPVKKYIHPRGMERTPW